MGAMDDPYVVIKTVDLTECQGTEIELGRLHEILHCHDCTNIAGHGRYYCALFCATESISNRYS